MRIDDRTIAVRYISVTGGDNERVLGKARLNHARRMFGVSGTEHAVILETRYHYPHGLSRGAQEFVLPALMRTRASSCTSLVGGFWPHYLACKVFPCLAFRDTRDPIT